MPLQREGRAQQKLSWAMLPMGIITASQYPDPERIPGCFPVSMTPSQSKPASARLVQTGKWREKPRVPDEHPDGIGHQEGIIQRPKKFLVVVPIWKTNIRATSAWPPSCVPSPWLLAQSCPPFPKAWSPQGLLGVWPGAISTRTRSCPVLDFTSHCCTLAQGHGTDVHHLITSGCLMSSWPPAKPWPRPGFREWGELSCHKCGFWNAWGCSALPKGAQLHHVVLLESLWGFGPKVEQLGCSWLCRERDRR